MRQFLPPFLVFVRKQPLFHIRTLRDYTQCGGIKTGITAYSWYVYSRSTKSLAQWHHKAPSWVGGAWEQRYQLCYTILTN
jgi:hypothetical protein